MADEIEKTLEDWKRQVDEMTKSIVLQTDKAILKAAYFCEGEAKKNAMTMIYNAPIPCDKSGKPLWERTGLYKASIGSGMNPEREHSAIIFNTVPYAKKIEFGSSGLSQGINSVRATRARPVMTSAVFQNKEQIRTIIQNYLKEVVK